MGSNIVLTYLVVRMDLKPLTSKVYILKKLTMDIQHWNPVSGQDPV